LLRYLDREYQTKGLEIILITETAGFFRTQLMETTAEEIELVRNFYLNFLKLPVTLGIDETRFSRLPDGRRMPEPVAWRRSWPQTRAVLIDRNGNFAALGMDETYLWKRIRYEIDQVVK
jgi:hypothetical protein